MGRKISPIWTTPIEEFKQVISKSNSLSAILECFNISATGGSYRSLKQRLKEENIDYSHIRLGSGCNKGREFPKTAIELSKVMIKNSTYSRGSLKRRLIRDGILENKCKICDQDEIWNGQKLVMVLDHKNGERDDHRLENLQMLCPNCNSQQKTFAGRQNKKEHKCKKCGTDRSRRNKSKLCIKCYYKNNPRKIKNRPSVKVLEEEVEKTSYRAVGRKYGVADTTIKSWIKSLDKIVKK